MLVVAHIPRHRRGTIRHHISPFPTDGCSTTAAREGGASHTATGAAPFSTSRVCRCRTTQSTYSVRRRCARYSIPQPSPAGSAHTSHPAPNTQATNAPRHRSNAHKRRTNTRRYAAAMASGLSSAGGSATVPLDALFAVDRRKNHAPRWRVSANTPTAPASPNARAKNGPPDVTKSTPCC